jgi:hypothetical protein
MSMLPFRKQKTDDKKSDTPPQFDHSKTRWGIFVGPVIGLISAALAALITGYFNAPKPKEPATNVSVVNNIVSYVRLGTYVGAKAVLQLAANPAIANSQLGDRFGSLAQHLNFLQGSEWSAGAAASNRVIRFSMVVRALPANPSANGSATFVLKRGNQTVCTATINTQTANKDSLSSWQRTTCDDVVAAGLDASYISDIKASNTALVEVYAENIVASKE